MYVKSGYEFDEAPDDIEDAMNKFERDVLTEQKFCQRKRKQILNISVLQWELIQSLRKNDEYIVVEGDKNLGPCILERDHYIKRGCLDHLGNSTNYRELSMNEAMLQMRKLSYWMDGWIMKYMRKKQLPLHERVFLIRSKRENPDQFARFRMTAKVHKTPWKTRPIVCCAGTWMNAWSKWLDHWLQKLKCHVPTFVKDSQQVLDEISDIKLPRGALLMTCDAVSMYNNIDTPHAIEVIGWWLDELHEHEQLPDGFPLDAIKDAMRIIMTHNIFGWGDMYFLQLVGTAMGTSAAVMWATLYYGYHEVHTLIPRHGNKMLYFRRFIDDIFAIWIGNLTTDWESFCADVNDFGILKWDVTENPPRKSVDFLDLTLTIDGNRIVSKTFQKKMNLYLYIPAASAHPEGCIKGTIFGLIRRYHAQNTYRKDYVQMVKLLYIRLLKRGWQSSFIRGLILDACTTCDETKKKTKPAPDEPPANSNSNSTPNSKKKLLFFHLQFHPEDISRKKIQEFYAEHCSDLFKEHMDIDRPVIAYSRPPNIGDYVTQAMLHEAPGKTASTYMGEYRQGLAP